MKRQPNLGKLLAGGIVTDQGTMKWIGTLQDASITLNGYFDNGSGMDRYLTREHDDSGLPIDDMSEDLLRKAAVQFMEDCGLNATPDAADQMVRVFLPCLAIMCRRPWDPNGATWRASGRMGILSDVRKKFERLWYRGWRRGTRHDDSGFDLINYIGFYMRSEESMWNEWGPPATAEIQEG